MTAWRSEARVSIVVVVAAAAVFVGALLLAPSFAVTFDEAKYLGIGYSMVEGHGPQIVFGGYFLPHAPVWPTVVVAPAVALAIDPLIVGRVLNALSGLGLVLLGAALAWRIRPAAAAVAAIGLLATTYLHELTRTARLDVPAATLAVAYLAVGLIAVRRGSTRYAIGAGLLFGVAFLVKEIVLPLAPVPILAAILHRQPWRPILRTTGWMTLSATLAVAPWFIFVADVSGRVYRLGTPAWTLLPIGLALLGVGLVGVLASRLTMPSIDRVLAERLDGPVRTRLVAAFTIAWVLGLILMFTSTLKGRGTALIDLVQIAGYVRVWYPFLITTAIGGVGLALSILAPRDPDRGRREAGEDLWLATVCGLPLVILVIGVGEPPRNYLAQLAIGTGIAAAGWLWLFQSAVRRWPTVTSLAVGALFGPVFGLVVGDWFGVGYRDGAVGGLVAGLLAAGALVVGVRRRRHASPVEPGSHGSPASPASPGSHGSPASPVSPAVIGLLLISLLGATGTLAFTIGLRLPDTTRQDAIETVSGWAQEHVEAGSTIAFGSFLGYEMALPLRREFTVRQVRHVLVVGDVDAPDGVRVFGKPTTDDWVAIDIAPRNINEFQAFSASTLIATLRKSGADYWIYSIGTTTSAPTIIPALEGATGFEQLAHRTFARPRGGALETYVYRLDLDHLALDTDRIHMAPDALERMVRLAEGKDATQLAQRLAGQVVADPRSAATDALIERLRLLGGP